MAALRRGDVMIVELALLLAGAQPEAAQPLGRFMVCPGHPRCPRSSDGESNAVSPSQAPSYGTVRLEGGFTPDPHVVRLTSGGEVDAATLQPGCTGFVSRAPDLRVAYQAGSLPLTFTALGANVSLLINSPDGRWHCTPLSAAGATYRFARPTSGRYEIWVGAPRGGGSAAQLQISEMD
jgi:hypothetical protein